MTKQRRADLMLLFTVLFWGISYIFLDECLRYAQPMTICAIRFTVGFAVVALFSFKKLRRISRATLLYSAAVGFFLAICYICVTVGVTMTSMSNAAFLCSLPVVMTPLFGLLLFRKRPSPRLALAIVIATTGVALMTLTESLRLGPGDLICILCALAYSFDLLLTERALARDNVDAHQLGVLQLGFAAVVELGATFLFERPQALPVAFDFWWRVLFLAVFCTGLAFLIQSLAQKDTSASHVGLIFALEPVFASVAAFFIAGERLAVRGYLGGALLLLAVVVMEAGPLKRKQKESTLR